MEFNPDSARGFVRLFNGLEYSRYRCIVRKYWQDLLNAEKCPRWTEMPEQFMPFSYNRPEGRIVLEDAQITEELKESWILRGDTWRPYQANSEKIFYERMHQKIVARLQRNTNFQKWISSQTAYIDALQLLHRKRLETRLCSRHELALISGIGPLYVDWFFQYILARALLAYYRYFDYPEELRKIHPAGVANYSEAARNSAKQLLMEIWQKKVRAHKETLLDLQYIAHSDEYIPFLHASEETLSILQRRTLFVREMALLGRGCLMSARGDSDRFPADVLKVSCLLINHRKVSEPGISGLMRKWEKSSEELPLTNCKKPSRKTVGSFFR